MASSAGRFSPPSGMIEIGEALGRLDEGQVHGAHRGVVLLAHLGERAAALLDVALHPAHEPDVGVGVDEDLEVHLGAQPLVGQHQDPFDQDDGGGLDPAGLLAAHVLAKVVLGDLDGLPGAQRAEVRDQELGLHRVRVVVVDGLRARSEERPERSR